MRPAGRAAYRDLPSAQRRAVRRAARRGRRGRVDPALAGPLLEFTRRRQGRARRVLVLAVLLILASAGAVAWVFLRYGPGLLLAVPVGGLLLGGTAGVVSESRLRRAEEAEALAEHQVRKRSEGWAPAPDAAPERPAPVQPVDGDAARERLARIISGSRVVPPEGDRAPGHPWD